MQIEYLLTIHQGDSCISHTYAHMKKRLHNTPAFPLCQISDEFLESGIVHLLGNHAWEVVKSSQHQEGKVDPSVEQDVPTMITGTLPTLRVPAKVHLWSFEGTHIFSV